MKKLFILLALMSMGPFSQAHAVWWPISLFYPEDCTTQGKDNGLLKSVCDFSVEVDQLNKDFKVPLKIGEMVAKVTLPFIELYAHTYLRRWLITPDLEIKRSPGFLDKVYNFVLRIKEEPREPGSLIYPPELKSFFDSYTRMVINCGKNKALVAPHLLLYGKPGTGKTAFMEDFLTTVEKEIPLQYKIIPAGNFYAYDSPKTIEMLNNLFMDAKKNYLRTGKINIIVIDEIDALLAFPTDQPISKEQANLVSCVLNHLRSDGKGVILIGATNIFPQKDTPSEGNENDHDVGSSKKFPENIERRFSFKIEVTLPKTEQRLEILRKYIQRHVLSNFKDPTTQASFLTDSYIEQLAHRTGGFSGSDLKQMCTNIEGFMAANEVTLLTEELLETYMKPTFDKKKQG
jgi:hypothetical protein